MVHGTFYSAGTHHVFRSHTVARRPHSCRLRCAEAKMTRQAARARRRRCSAARNICTVLDSADIMVLIFRMSAACWVTSVSYRRNSERRREVRRTVKVV